MSSMASPLGLSRDAPNNSTLGIVEPYSFNPPAFDNNESWNDLRAPGADPSIRRADSIQQMCGFQTKTRWPDLASH